MTHRDNTIPDHVWRDINRRIPATPFGTRAYVRRMRLAVLGTRAARAGRN